MENRDGLLAGWLAAHLVDIKLCKEQVRLLKVLTVHLGHFHLGHALEKISRFVLCGEQNHITSHHITAQHSTAQQCTAQQIKGRHISSQSVWYHE